MSISSTRKISSTSPASSRADRSYYIANNSSQSVENIDTRNNVLIKDENNKNFHHQQQQKNKEQEDNTNYKTGTPDIINGIEAIASSIDIQESDNLNKMQKIDVYNNNQSIIHDQDVEHTGRNYLKHFYEKNEHIPDIDTLV